MLFGLQKVGAGHSLMIMPLVEDRAVRVGETRHPGRYRFSVLCKSAIMVAIMTGACAKELPPNKPAIWSHEQIALFLASTDDGGTEEVALLDAGSASAAPEVLSSFEPAHVNDNARVDRAKRLNDGEVVQLLIKESIDNYAGNCPCPYNTDSAGRLCGGRSAWSRAGGEEPLCFPKNVTPTMIRERRAR